MLRILRPMFAVGVMDAEPGAWDAEKHSVNASTEENIVTARNLSAQSTVLLKNNGVLPLKGSARIIIMIIMIMIMIMIIIIITLRHPPLIFFSQQLSDN